MEERRTAQNRKKKMKESDTKFLVKKTKPNIRIDDIIFTRGSTLCTGEFPKIYLPKVKFCILFFRLFFFY